MHYRHDSTMSSNTTTNYISVAAKFLLFLIAILGGSCQSKNSNAQDGWLNLVGLFWLEEGFNTFGSSEKNQLVFPSGKILDQAGYFKLEGGIVTIHTTKETGITDAGKEVIEQVIYHPDLTKATILRSGSLQWNVIKRDTKFGIRLRDLESEQQKTFSGIERFPIDPEYRVEATFVQSPDSLYTIDITNVLGQTTPQKSPGKLVFSLKGKKYQLEALSGNKEEFFVIFADATNGAETYGGGRFIYVRKPNENNVTYIDFNKAYNPPCVFTPYATCPLPPKSNEVDLKIKAGEKNYPVTKQHLNELMPLDQ